MPPRFPADAQTLPLLEVEDVEVAAAAAVVVLVVLALVFFVFFFLSLLFLVAVVVSAAAVVVAAAAGAGAGAAAEVRALLPPATLHYQLASHLATVRRLNLFCSNIRHKQILGKNTPHWIIGNITSIALGSRIANRPRRKGPRLDCVLWISSYGSDLNCEFKCNSLVYCRGVGRGWVLVLREGLDFRVDGSLSAKDGGKTYCAGVTFQGTFC